MSIPGVEKLPRESQSVTLWSAMGAGLGIVGGFCVAGLAWGASAWASPEPVTLSGLLALQLNPFLLAADFAPLIGGALGASGFAAGARSTWHAARSGALADAVATARDAVELELANIADGLVLTDANGTVLAVNLSFERMSGLPGSRVVGQPIETLVPGLNQDADERAIWRRTSRGQKLGYAFYVDAVHADGGTYPCEVAFEPVRHRDVNRVLYALRDVAQDRVSKADLALKEAELANARHLAGTATRARTAIFSALSHEMLTPLNAVIGYGELIAEDIEDGNLDGIGQDVSRILDSGDRLRKLIRGLLDLSRVEAGRETAFLEWFDLGEVIEEALESPRKLAEARQSTLDVSSTLKSLHVNLDRSKVLHVLTVLIEHACLFTERGRVTVGIVANSSTQTIAFRVADSGEGIPNLHRHLVFEAFPELCYSIPRLAGAQSLSLALAKQYTLLMGGTLELEGELEEGGNAFLLELPLDAAAAAGAMDDDTDEDDDLIEGQLVLRTPDVLDDRGAYAPKRPRSTSSNPDAANQPNEPARKASVQAGPAAAAPAPSTVPAAATAPEPASAPPAKAPAEEVQMTRTFRPTLIPSDPGGGLSRQLTAEARRRRKRRRKVNTRFSVPPQTVPVAPPKGTEIRGRVIIVDFDEAARNALADRLAAQGWWVSCCDHVGEAIHLARAKRPDLVIVDVVQTAPDVWSLRRPPHDGILDGVPMVLIARGGSETVALPIADVVSGPVDRAQFAKVLSRFPPKIGGKLLLVDGERSQDSVARVAANRLGWTVVGHQDLAKDDVGNTFDLVVVELFTENFDSLELLMNLSQRPVWHNLPVVMIVPTEMNDGEASRLRHWLDSDLRPAVDLPLSIEEACELVVRDPAAKAEIEPS